MQFYYDSVIWEGTLTDSGTVSGFPVDNLQDRSREKPTRLNTVSSGTITVDAGSGNTFTVDAIALFNYNFTSAVTITLQGNATASWGSPSFEKVLTYRENGIAEEFTAQTYRFFRLLITDPTHTGTYLELGAWILGTKADVANVSPDANVGRPTYSKAEFTRSGQVRGVKRRNRFEEQFNLIGVNDTKRKELKGVFEEQHTVVPLVLLVWENSLDVLDPLYFVFTMDGFSFKQNKQEGLLWDTSFSGREVF